MMQMILICGLPNAGKTTYSARYDNVVHLDDFLKDGSVYPLCQKALSEMTGDVCVEGIYGRKQQRISLIQSCEKQPYKICIWLKTPLHVCLERSKTARSRSIVMAHYNRFQPPTLDEGWDEIIIVRGG